MFHEGLRDTLVILVYARMNREVRDKSAGDRRKKYFCSVCKAQKDLERGGGTPIYGLA